MFKGLRLGQFYEHRLKLIRKPMGVLPVLGSHVETEPAGISLKGISVVCNRRIAI